jgi:hypothetical protein
MVSKMMFRSIIQFLVFFAAATGAEAHSRSFQQTRSLQELGTRHYDPPGAKDMPLNRK